MRTMVYADGCSPIYAKRVSIESQEFRRNELLYPYHPLQEMRKWDSSILSHEHGAVDNPSCACHSVFIIV